MTSKEGLEQIRQNKWTCCLPLHRFHFLKPISIFTGWKRKWKPMIVSINLSWPNWWLINHSHPKVHKNILEPKRLQNSFVVGYLLLELMSDCNPMDCMPGSLLVHEIFQANNTEWAAISLSRGIPSWPRGFPTQVSLHCRILYHRAILGSPQITRNYLKPGLNTAASAQSFISSKRPSNLTLGDLASQLLKKSGIHTFIVSWRGLRKQYANAHSTHSNHYL